MKVKELFSDPKRWSEACMARDANNRPAYDTVYDNDLNGIVINIDKERAVSFCLVGAIA